MEERSTENVDPKTTSWVVTKSYLEVYPSTKNGENGLIIQIMNDRNRMVRGNSQEESIGLGLFLEDPLVYTLNDLLHWLAKGPVGEGFDIETEEENILRIDHDSIHIIRPKTSDDREGPDRIDHTFKSPVVRINNESRIPYLRKGEFLQFIEQIKAYCEVAPRKYMESELDMNRMYDLMAETSEEETVEE